ncbi:MAG: WecB/TagA/CpsF family glycosyltransferase [Chloroflexi bacterium]|nr:WecB/TagA/CpsF family glycosyltransferase [Chloroflexota bacterium]
MRRLAFLAVPVDDVTTPEALDWFAHAIAGRSCAQVCTVNPEFVMAAQHNAAFRAVLQAAPLCLPDGQGLLWASRLRGHTLRERVAGSSFVWRIGARAAADGWRIFLLGAAEGVAAAAAQVLCTAHPALQVVGTYSGSPHPDALPAILAQVHAAQPDVLLVAYGAPQQDLWIAANRAVLAVPVMMGVGGALDFVAGVAQRAPQWMQQLGLEWLHRLLLQPWRWRRMLALPQFAWLMLTQPDAVREI